MTIADGVRLAANPRKSAVSTGESKRRGRRRSKQAYDTDRDGRRKLRRARKSRGPLLGFLFGILVVVTALAPTLLCQLPFAHAYFASTLADYGFSGSYQSVRIGWLSPLRVSGIKLLGQETGSELTVEQIDCDASLLSLLGNRQGPFQLSARGVTLATVVGDGWSGLERDLEPLLAATASGDDSSLTSGDSATDGSGLPPLSIDVQNATVRLTDIDSREVTTLDQLMLQSVLTEQRLTATVSAVASDAQTGSGSLALDVEQQLDGQALTKLSATVQRLPLRVGRLIKRRFPVEAASWPQQLTGDMSGSIRVASEQAAADQPTVWTVEASPLEIRNLVAQDAAWGPQTWRNGLVVLRGSMMVEPTRLRGDQLVITTDFAEMSLSGLYTFPADALQMANPVAWVAALDGTAGGRIDLALLTQQMPGLIPLKPNTEIVSSVIQGEITSQARGDGGRQVLANLYSEPLRASADNRSVVLEPVTVAATVNVAADNSWHAERCELVSVFGRASLSGDLSRGQAQADFDLGRLANLLEPLIELPELGLGGTASGNLNWAAMPDDQWRLQGDANANSLMIGLADGWQLQRPSLQLQVDAAGRWADGQLQEVSAATLTLRTESLEADATLGTAVAQPSSDSHWPLRITGRGRLEVLPEFIGVWLPTSLHSLSGAFNGQADLTASVAGGEVRSVKLILNEPRAGWENRLFAQSEMTVDFQGSYQWPSGTLMAQAATLAGESISGAAKGTMAADQVDLEVAFRADLQRLQGTVLPAHAVPGGPARLASTTAATAATASVEPAAWRYAGRAEGNARLTQPSAEAPLHIETQISGSGLAISEVASNTPGQNYASGRPVWEEPTLNLNAAIDYHAATGTIQTQRLLIAADWLTAELAGPVVWNDQENRLDWTGTAKLQMDQVAQRLTTLVGTDVRLQGVHQTPLNIQAAYRQDQSLALEVQTNLGWQSGEIAGVVFGASSIPLHISETTVMVQQANVPVGQGRIQASADLYYQPGPMWIQVQPGMVAQNLQMTGEMSDRWLQYLAPIVAQATRIDGTFSVDLAEAIVHLDDPMQSRVRGQLQINQVNFDAGPMTHQLLSSVQQLQMLAKTLKGETAVEPASDRTVQLATLPTQSVDFSFAGGVVTHQRMFMDIDRARLITSGQVHVNGNLDLVTQLPLDARWLGSDLQSLAGQSVTLPIGGTLSSPRVDAAAIRGLATQFGAQAIQQQAENYLEKQLGRGLERLLGK